jgi:hypothetical protein
MEERKMNVQEACQEEMNSNFAAEVSSEIGADIMDNQTAKPKHNTDIVRKINSIFLSGSGLMRAH